MVDCRYCDDAFAGEEEYLDHLEASHRDELTRIDRRRVEDNTPDAEGIPNVIYYGIAGVLIVILLVGAMWAAWDTGGGERVHEHGELTVVIDGEPVNFDQAQYHAPERFHFHPGDPRWHMHPDRLTFEEAMADLGVPVEEGLITVDGTTYDDAESDVSVTMTINEEPAALDQPIHDGDRIEIVVETDT